MLSLKSLSPSRHGCLENDFANWLLFLGFSVTVEKKENILWKVFNQMIFNWQLCSYSTVTIALYAKYTFLCNEHEQT